MPIYTILILDKKFTYVKKLLHDVFVFVCAYVDPNDIKNILKKWSNTLTFF